MHVRDDIVVLPLWGTFLDGMNLIRKEEASPRRIIGGILPSQHASPETLDHFEAIGILTMIVPESLKNEGPEALAAHIKAELEKTDAIYEQEQIRLQTQDTPTVYDDSEDSENLSAEDEARLLQAINDPDADEGGTT